MINIVRNKSMTYFLPVLDKIVPIKHFDLLKNTYFWYNDFSEETFALLYKFNGRIYGKHASRTGFTVFEQELRKNENYLGETDYGEYVVYVFKLPEELIELKYTIVRGEYSKIPEDFKQIILNFVFNHYGAFDASVVKQILYKDDEFRAQLAESLHIDIPSTAELSSVIDIERELFSNHVENNKDITNENKDQENWGWNPWTTANKSK